MQLTLTLFGFSVYLCCCYFRSVSADVPTFVSAFGLTVRSSSPLTPQLYEVIVASEQVRGDQKIRILLPSDYTTSSSTRRYPTLYLLHGAYGGAADWTTSGEAQTICGNASLITVMPNGDPHGFYTNWVNPGDSAPQNWRTYHMEQLVPWIDFNLRTVAKKQSRAITGLSMGGFGTIHYAERYPDNFIYATSFSGALDTLDARVQKIILNITQHGDVPFTGPFGYPTEPITATAWFSENTLVHATALRDLSVALYTGNTGPLESTLRDGSYRLRDLLISFNIPVHFNDYGDGQSIGHGCDGGHDWPCWNAALVDVLPRIMAILEQQY